MTGLKKFLQIVGNKISNSLKVSKRRSERHKLKMGQTIFDLKLAIIDSSKVEFPEF